MGLVHIICGDGKGKTSSAIGLAIRSAGRNHNVLIARFMKNNDSGELAILEQINQITLIPNEKDFGFTWNLTEEEKEEANMYFTDMLAKTIKEVRKKQYDLLILDEIISANNYEFLPKKQLIDFINHRPEKLEVVMTGRNPEERLCDLADYISEVKKIKHPYEKGIPARVGIEY